ncbi:MAG: ABC-three component system protein [Candidatus Aminicenantales bacterium]
MSLLKDPQVRAWYEMLFQLKVRHKYGLEFQDFFSDLMSRRYPGDFRKVRPAGQHGDRKCDGLLPSEHQLFQCYAPERMETRPAIKKIEEDFYGAITHWGALFKTWIFVHNQYSGLPPDVERKLQDINGHKGYNVSIWAETVLRNLVFGLDDGDIVGLFGPPLDPRSVKDVGFQLLKEVLDQIAKSELDYIAPIMPVETGKVEFNRLSSNIASWLNVGRQKAVIVKDLFAKWIDPELGDKVAKTFKERYEALRNAGYLPDNIFNELWIFAGGGRQPDQQLETAVLAILAYLFDSCDVFENASKELS